MRNQALQPKLFLGGFIWRHFVCSNVKKKCTKVCTLFKGAVYMGVQPGVQPQPSVMALDTKPMGNLSTKK